MAFRRYCLQTPDLNIELSALGIGSRTPWISVTKAEQTQQGDNSSTEHQTVRLALYYLLDPSDQLHQKLGIVG